jgi:hypothetical protein
LVCFRSGTDGTNGQTGLIAAKTTACADDDETNEAALTATKGAA